MKTRWIVKELCGNSIQVICQTRSCSVQIENTYNSTREQFMITVYVMHDILVLFYKYKSFTNYAYQLMEKVGSETILS